MTRHRQTLQIAIWRIVYSLHECFAPFAWMIYCRAGNMGNRHRHGSKFLPKPVIRHDKLTRPQKDADEYRSRVGYALRSAHIASIQHFARTVTRNEVSPLQFSMLLFIEQRPGINPTQLSKSLGVKRANITVLLHELEEKKLIRRLPAIDDRRFYGLESTALGKRRLAAWLKLADRHEQRLADLIGVSGRDKFLRTLLRISDRLNDPELE
jgi:DNA-binding MarR family transcriptional regulator